MKRRDFIKTGTAAAAGAALGTKALGKEPAPDYMPILDEKMARGEYLPHYVEREITEPVLLCDERGRLNPDAIGWARKPLIQANLSGHWPRKKRWNFWNWITPDFVFSITIADIDFATFCAVSFTDFRTRESKSGIGFKRGNSIDMPEEVEGSVVFETRKMLASLVHHGDHIKVDFRGKAGGEEATADFRIIYPEGHETLNVVVPWSDQRFQCNSKHNTLPCEGEVKIGGKSYTMDPAECHGVHDWGRGMWPYRSYWNWGVCTGVLDGDLIGVNFGAKWTTGTGSNENGICYNGRLHKVMEDLIWEYDPDDWMKPWRVRSGHTDAIDLTMTPILANSQKISLGLLGTGGTCSFGHWNGTIRFDGKVVEIRDMIGWGEEFSHRW